jgi:hypothetical protein
MRKIALLVLSTVIVSTVSFAQSSSPENVLSNAEKQQGWKLIFDGTSLSGWHSFNKKTVGKAWNVDHGAIHLDASNKSNYQSEGGGDLVTAESYQNFDLRLEWKISKNGNSGIIFDVQEDSKYADTWLTGPEMQVLDNDGHPDGKIHKHRAGDLYDLIASSSEPVKAVGEWNMAEIKLNNGKLDLFLNGVNVVSTTMWDDNWWKMVKESKFGKMPDFTKSKSGHIALQDHGNDVWFRNIKILQL